MSIRSDTSFGSISSSGATLGGIFCRECAVGKENCLSRFVCFCLVSNLFSIENFPFASMLVSGRCRPRSNAQILFLLIREASEDVLVFRVRQVSIDILSLLKRLIIILKSIMPDEKDLRVRAIIDPIWHTVTVTHPSVGWMISSISTCLMRDERHTASPICCFFLLEKEEEEDLGDE